MKVLEIRDMMNGLIEQGFSDTSVQAWDPDLNCWEEVTVATYGVNRDVRLYTDDID